ncbi:MAG: fimbrillin family protein, partial [Bacteroidales bacterium]|nr:fimbrillin family protein [Bacteroidales bacterium]
MKKYLILAATAALVLGACSKNDVEIAEEKTPVTFGTYLGKAVTKAGDTGSINTPQTLAQKDGFGVFAYYTGATAYSAGQTAYTPNFMYNEHVEGTDAASPVWDYGNHKFWPNGNAVADNTTNGAVGDGAGKLSFFAYGPYAAPGNSETEGIISFSAAGTAGDPTVTYILNGVDLLWGTAGNSDATTNGTAQAGDTLTGGKAAVNVDLTKQKTNGKVKFAFKHALAKLGKIQVVADISNGDALTGGTQGNTKITVSQVIITPDAANGKGTLNLATGVWTLATPASDVTPAALSIETADMADAVKEPATVTEWAHLTGAGVTATAANLLKEGA